MLAIRKILNTPVQYKLILIQKTIIALIQLRFLFRWQKIDLVKSVIIRLDYVKVDITPKWKLQQTQYYT